MAGRHYYCDLLTREYHLFVDLGSGSKDIILDSFSLPLRTRQKPRFYFSFVWAGTLYRAYTILLLDSWPDHWQWKIIYRCEKKNLLTFAAAVCDSLSYCSDVYSRSREPWKQ